jgi:alkylation response protein AidB-like acyl-CoA dehydrogenase
MSTTAVEQVKGGSFLLTPIGAMPQFTPEEFGDDAKEVARAARDFIQGEVLPRDEEIDKLNLPLTIELMKKAGELGLLGLEIPEAYEGMDVDKRSALLVLEEMS